MPAGTRAADSPQGFRLQPLAHACLPAAQLGFLARAAEDDRQTNETETCNEDQCEPQVKPHGIVKYHKARGLRAAATLGGPPAAAAHCPQGGGASVKRGG